MTARGDPLAEIIADLRDEQAALEAVLAQLSPGDWDRPTHARGWAVRDQVAHIAALDKAATQAIVEPGEFLARFAPGLSEPGEHERTYIAEGRALTPAGLLDRWRTHAAALIDAARGLTATDRIPWFGPDMAATSFLSARLMETWSHGLDIVDVTGTPRPDTDRLRHICFLGVRTRSWSYQLQDLDPPNEPVYVDLRLPSGAPWTAGDPAAVDTVRGSATDFCRVVTQRRHVADTALTVDGPFAMEWMLIAQAFAGPPGGGREPGKFPAP